MSKKSKYTAGIGNILGSAGSYHPEKRISPHWIVKDLP